MDAKIELQRYKKIVDRRLAEYFSEKIKEAKKIDPLAVQAIKNIRDLTLAGGKRVRASFMYWGYKAAQPTRSFGEASGRRDDEKIIEASMSIELTNIFLLIHDDIIDRDDFRHGVKTIHKRYENLARRFYKQTDPIHFGDSMALVVGDMAAAAGNEIIFNSRFSPERILKALDKLQDIISVTVGGELMDVILEARRRATEEEILKVHENKTAKYTVEGPLHLGAMLAGADKKILSVLSAYSIPVGIGFQIQDDILGVFGNEKKLGKPICSDLRKGVQTLLVSKAVENGNLSQRRILKRLIGKADATEGDIETFKKIVIETGSLDYSKKMSEELVRKGKKAIEKSGIRKDAKEFLIGIADHIVNREV
ncbi:MAG TPA: polyprenyl synthetase family protein [Candidatus Bathyarchaeia archaeon]|nr:polyprenyl synthetase family protein [Candidatus Bathyarchaeia archaeon]